MLKLIIAGSREFNDYELLCKEVNNYLIESFKGPIIKEQIQIVSGGAKGADTLAVEYALKEGLQFNLYPAEWEKYGKSAGYIRNSEMASYADALICFWDSESKGTYHMISCMKHKSKPYKVIKYKKVI